MAIPRNLANIAPHVNASSTELVVNDGGANLDFRVEGDTNANLLVADAGAEKVGFGTNTFNTNGGVIQVSNGISFPATQSACADANTLDDYEEGTFTPGINNGLDFPSPGGSALYEGRYTKIGNVVYVTILLNFDASGTNMAVGNAIAMNGLPFSSSVTPLGAGMGNSIPSLGTADRAFHWVGFRTGTNFGVVITDLQGTVNFGTSLTLSFAYFV